FFKNFPQTRLVGTSSFAEAFEAVSSGEAFYAVVPIENSASGTLHKTYDLLVNHDVVIGGELGVRETYCLCAKEGVELGAVRNVFSHPNILEACSVFLEARLAPGFHLASTRTSDGGGPARGALRGGRRRRASREAAARHGLRALAEERPCRLQALALPEGRAQPGHEAVRVLRGLAQDAAPRHYSQPA
ncbi:unnamed protein product, partial [Prorocentrum cordatum]